MNYCVGVAMIDQSVITCPLCGTAKSERMRTDACWIVYECTGSHVGFAAESGRWLRVLFVWLSTLSADPDRAQRGSRCWGLLS